MSELQTDDDRPSSGPMASYGMAAAWALGGAVVAVALRALLHPLLQDELPYITIFPVVLVVALVAGAVAGVLSLVLMLAAIVYFVVDPVGALWVDPGHAAALLLTAGASSVLIGIAASYRHLRLQSEQAAAELRQVADSLRDSEERFRRLTELSPDAMLVVCNGTVVYANRATVRLMRARSQEQVLGRSPLEVVHPESRANVEMRIRKTLATGEPNPPLEYTCFRFDGSTMTVEATSTLSPWQGQPAVQIIARDITARKATESRLLASRRDLEDLFEHAPVAIHWVDGEGRIIRANRTELEMLGYAASDYVGRRAVEFHAEPEAAEHMLAEVRAGKGAQQVESRLRRADGTLREVIISANACVRDGDYAYARCFTQDVTEQRNAERELKAAIDRFRLCISATRDVMYDWKVAAGLIEWNESLRGLLQDPEAPLETSYSWWQSRVHAEDLPRLERKLDHALAGADEQWSGEYRFRRADGSYAAVLDRAVIARDEHGVAVRVVGAMIDVTDQQRWERELAERAAELERSNKELEDFARLISHDLKEPLRGITDYSGYLRSDYTDVLDDKGRDMLETLSTLAGRMESLLDGLMEYARVGRMELRTTQVDLSQVLADVLQTLRSRIEREHAQVVLESRLPECRCDPMLMGQVFTNLIVNAIKYNAREEKRIEIGCVRHEDAEPIIYIRDNGIGIDERHYEDVFQMFRRLHARDRFGGGSGSGLSIIKKIVERHGGRVWLQSRPEEGSTFYFTCGAAGEDDAPVPDVHPQRRQQSPQDTD